MSSGISSVLVGFMGFDFRCRCILNAFIREKYGGSLGCGHQVLNTVKEELCNCSAPYRVDDQSLLLWTRYVHGTRWESWCDTRHQCFSTPYDDTAKIGQEESVQLPYQPAEVSVPKSLAALRPEDIGAMSVLVLSSQSSLR